MSRRRDADVPDRRPVRALLVDDESLARRRLASMLADEPEIELIAAVASGSEAVHAIATSRPDLVFLDVQMPGLDGFGVLRCTLGSHQAALVFVTAHDEYALRAFEVNAVDYLLKPVSTSRLRQAVDRAVRRIRSGATHDHAQIIDGVLSSVPQTPATAARIPIKTTDGIRLVNVTDIVWVEANGDQVRVHVGAAVHVVRETMAHFEQRVAPFAFVRVHRSVLVNTSAVITIKSIAKGGYSVGLSDGTSVRSGRRYRARLQSLIR